MLQPGKRRFEVVTRHRALLERTQHARAELLFVEGLPGPVALDHPGQMELHVFVGREALSALSALAAPSHLHAFADQPRVDDPGLLRLAERAVHGGGGSRFLATSTECRVIQDYIRPQAHIAPGGTASSRPLSMFVEPHGDGGVSVQTPSHS